MSNLTPLTLMQLEQLNALNAEPFRDDFLRSQDLDHQQPFIANDTIHGGGSSGVVSPLLDSIFWNSQYIAQNMPQLQVGGSERVSGAQPMGSPAGFAALGGAEFASPAVSQDVMSTSDSSSVIGGSVSTRHTEYSPPGASQRGSKGGDGQQLGLQTQLQTPLVQQLPLSESEIMLKKKAQNRLLQRLFRERKETKLKELSTKLSQTETEKLRLELELALLRQQNVMLSTENLVLMKNGTVMHSSDGVDGLEIASTADDAALAAARNVRLTFPVDKNKFLENIIFGSEHDTGKTVDDYPSLVYSKEGKQVLTLGAVWDYLYDVSLKHEDWELDITWIMDRLSGNEICHGYGPGYPLLLVDDTILELVNSQ